MYYGDFRAGQTVRCRFNTVAPTTGAPATLASGAVVVSKDGADVTPSGGVTLTVDAGGVAGRHNVAIDTSVDPATFTAGSDYSVRVLAGTVGGTSIVGMIVGEWSILNRGVGAVTLSGTQPYYAPAKASDLAPLATAEALASVAGDAAAIRAKTDGLAVVDGKVDATVMAIDPALLTTDPIPAEIMAVAPALLTTDPIPAEIAATQFDALAKADQIPAAFVDATFAGPGVFAAAALAAAPAGGGGSGTALTADEAQAACAAAIAAADLPARSELVTSDGILTDVDLATALGSTPVGIKDGGIATASYAAGATVPLPATPPAGYGGGLTTDQSAALAAVSDGVQFVAGMQLRAVAVAGSTASAVLLDGSGLSATSGDYTTTAQKETFLLGVVTANPRNRVARQVSTSTASAGVVTLNFAAGYAWPVAPSAGDVFAIITGYR